MRAHTIQDSCRPHPQGRPAGLQQAPVHTLRRCLLLFLLQQQQLLLLLLFLGLAPLRRLRWREGGCLSRVHTEQQLMGPPPPLGGLEGDMRFAAETPASAAAAAAAAVGMGPGAEAGEAVVAADCSGCMRARKGGLLLRCGRGREASAGFLPCLQRVPSCSSAAAAAAAAPKGPADTFSEVYRHLETALRHWVDEKQHKVEVKMQRLRKLQRSAWGAFLVAAAAHQLVTETATLHICTAYCSGGHLEQQQQQQQEQQQQEQQQQGLQQQEQQQQRAGAAAEALGFASAADARAACAKLCGLPPDGQPRLLQQLLQREALLQQQTVECTCCCRCCCLCSVAAALLARRAVLTLLLQFLQQQQLLRSMPAELRQDVVGLLDELQLQLHAVLPQLRGCTQISPHVQQQELEQLLLQQQAASSSSRSSSSSSMIEAIRSSNGTICCCSTTEQQLQMRRLWRCALLLQLQELSDSGKSSSGSNGSNSSSSSSSSNSSSSKWEILCELPFGQLVALVLQQPAESVSLIERLEQAAALLPGNQQRQQQQQQFWELSKLKDEEEEGVAECEAWLQALKCLLDSVLALLLPRVGSSSSSSGSSSEFVRLLLHPSDEWALGIKMLQEDGSDCRELQAAAVCCAACDGVVALLQRQLAAAAAAAAAAGTGSTLPLLLWQTQGEALQGDRRQEGRLRKLQAECLCTAFKACEASVRLCALLRPSEDLLALLAARQQHALPDGAATHPAAAAAAAAAAQLLPPAQHKVLQRLLLLQQDAQARVLSRARIVEDTAAFLRSGGGLAKQTVSSTPLTAALAASVEDAPTLLLIAVCNSRRAAAAAQQQQQQQEQQQLGCIDAADVWGGLLPGQLQRQLLDPPLTMDVLLQRMQDSAALTEAVVTFLSLALASDPSIFKETAAAAAAAAAAAPAAATAAAAAVDAHEQQMSGVQTPDGPWGFASRRATVGFLSALAWLPPAALRLCLLTLHELEGSREGNGEILGGDSSSSSSSSSGCSCSHLRWIVLLLLGVHRALQLSEEKTATGAAWCVVEVLQNHAVDLEAEEVLVPLESAPEGTEPAMDTVYRELVAVTENPRYTWQLRIKAMSLAQACRPSSSSSSSSSRRLQEQLQQQLVLHFPSAVLSDDPTLSLCCLHLQRSAGLPADAPLSPFELLPKFLQLQQQQLQQQPSGLTSAGRLVLLRQLRLAALLLPPLLLSEGVSPADFQSFWQLVFEVDRPLWRAVSNAEREQIEGRSGCPGSAMETPDAAAAGSEGAAADSAAAEAAGDRGLGLHACILLRTLFYELLCRYGPGLLALPPAAPPDDCLLAAAAAVQQQLPQQVVLLLRHYVASQQQRVASATAAADAHAA
ncbi:hypothetical protein Esti_002897 [Eimeria stiedai]